MSSNSFNTFSKSISRCETLVSDYKQLQKMHAADNSIPAPKDMVRGAVVLAIAALDAYVTNVFAEKLVPYLKKHRPGDQLVNLLHEAGLDTREALTLINMERPYRRIRTLISRHYAKYTTQKFDVIDSIFLPYGIKNISDNAAAKTEKQTIKTSVGKLIERRHEIAHSGDYNSHNRLKQIDEDQIEKRIKHLELLVRNMDDIICNRI